MGTTLKFKYGTDSQILALTPASENWVERAFYYPDDKNYFYQVVNGEMKRYGAGTPSLISEGVTINDKTIGGVKTYIESGDILNIPDKYDYNTYKLSSEGTINCYGNINIHE